MDGFELCLGELEGLIRAMDQAGLCELAFRSSRGSLLLRGSGEGVAPAGTGSGKGLEGCRGADGENPGRLVLLRSHCVGRWSRADGNGGGPLLEKGAALGTISTLLGEERLAAPGPGRVEKWIIGEGEVAGYGAPIALFKEVG